MSFSDAWSRRLEAALGSPVQESTPISGGDINEAFRVVLADRRRLFVKANAHSPPRMFQAEADGLAFLRAGIKGSSPLVIPEVVHIDPEFLALELLERSARDESESLGRGLAALHATPLSSFGSEASNFIGTLGQINDPLPKWVDFFRARRLQVQLDLPGARRLIDKECRRRFEILFARLDQLLLPEEPPARVHGDLWSGNYFFSTRGPALFDPAAFGGHREVDLAMMKLFGGFSPRVFAAYEEAHPLAPGSEERLSVYQLYPLLVHVNLFGAGYVGSVEDTLRRVT